MHPSLKLDYNLPPLLKPQRIMERNDPCWCGSGIKWKKCHKDRDLQEPDPIGKMVNNIHKNHNHGMCLFPEELHSECSNKVIKAHTIQRAGGLKSIAENGHVISAKKGSFNIFKNQGEIVPELIGIGNASTFMGFCSYHDNLLFEPTENITFRLNNETAFLLSFRALCYEYLSKLNSINSIKYQRNMDKGCDFDTQIVIQNSLHTLQIGKKLGMKNLVSLKKYYDKKLLSNDFNSLSHYTIEFGSIFPLVCCGGFYPEIDFNGNQLQKLTSDHMEYELVLFNLSVINSHSFLSFGWHGEKNGPAEQFVKSFKALNNEEKANAALLVAVEQLENTYFTPSWWQGLTSVNKQYLVNRMIPRTPTYQKRLSILPEITIIGEVDYCLK